MDKKPETTDKPLFDNLRKLINLIDSFRDVGLHEHIELPRIAVLGICPLTQEHNLVENLHYLRISLDWTFCQEVLELSPEDLLNCEWSISAIVKNNLLSHFQALRNIRTNKQREKISRFRRN